MYPKSRRSFLALSLSVMILLALMMSACNPQIPPISTATSTSTLPPKATATLLPQATATLAPSATASATPGSDLLAPDGDYGVTYYAPFDVEIQLDGSLEDWQGVPTVTLPGLPNLDPERPAITFAAAADGEFLYLMGDVVDDNIISGKHEANYWNEDSVEFYLNGTGELNLTSYTDGVAQITIPPLNIGQDEAIFGGINAASTGAQAVVVKTERGYAIEVAVPLVNNVWDLTPAHAKTIGFQVHVNVAATADRDSKLMWSLADQNDASYQNPSLFGQLIFYKVGQADLPTFNPTPLPEPTATFEPVSPAAAYKNPNLPVEERVEDLLAQMSLSEKIGQMTQVEKNSISGSEAGKYFIGSILSGGGGFPNVNMPNYWAKMVTRYQESAMETRLGVPILYGVDAIHGHNNMRTAVIFPHNIGLGAANDAELMTRIGRVTASEMIASGVYWNFAPVLAVPQDIRWGRTYEGFGEDTSLVTRLATAYLQGLQGSSLSDPLSVVGSLKHYVGDGGTAWGTSTTGDYKLDQGVTDVDEATLRAIHLPPYQAGIEAGARIVMVSYSSWGGMKMHAQKYLISDVLKGEMGFTGFVVSDWGGVDQISSNYYDSVVAAINAGVDMNMVPYDYMRFVTTLAKAVENGDVSQERIDDAVRRILRVKFEMGLFEHPYANESQLPLVGSEEHRAVAREAVSKSLVLLKNDNQALPLSKGSGLLYVAGLGANDIGMQSGGWTITWQGGLGDITPGTTLLQAISQTVSAGVTVEYAADGSFAAGATADACVVVVGETPYAEGLGDKADLALSAADQDLIARMRPQCQKLVVVLYSGRPMIITELLPQVDAFVAAWLPGSEGQGIADVLFGDLPFTGKLPYTWPRSMEQLPFDFQNLPTGEDGVLFPFGFGLTD